MERFKDRAGLVFVCEHPIQETSKEKFQTVMLSTGIIDIPFETIETIDNVTFFVCKESESCKFPILNDIIRSNPQLMFLNNHLFRIDALQAFLKEL